MSRKDPPIIQMSDVEALEHPYYLVRSMSDDASVYTVNCVERTCECNDFLYRKQKEGKYCKHISSVLRFRAIKQSQQD